MDNKNKSNIIKIINNNNINSNINMLIKIQPKCKIQRKNTDIYINNETSDNNKNISDTFIEKKLKKLKYTPIFTKINLFSKRNNINKNKKFLTSNPSPIKNFNKLKKAKHYSSRNFFIILNSVNDEILKHNKLKLQKVKFMKYL